MLAFAIAQMPIMFAFQFEQEALSSSYFRFIASIGNQQLSVLRDVFRDRLGEPFIPCTPRYALLVMTTSVAHFFNSFFIPDLI